MTKVVRVDHIGVAVNAIEPAAGLYRDMLGMTIEDIITVPEKAARVAFIPAGESNIELVEPLTPDSWVKKFIDERGEGIHHICLEVDDIQAALDRMAAAGYRLIDRRPVRGAHGLVAFVHPKSCNGVLLELTQLDHGHGA
jgi:methylmalonyl-CoA epimerase